MVSIWFSVRRIPPKNEREAVRGTIILNQGREVKKMEKRVLYGMAWHGGQEKKIDTTGRRRQRQSK